MILKKGRRMERTVISDQNWEKEARGGKFSLKSLTVRKGRGKFVEGGGMLFFP